MKHRNISYCQKLAKDLDFNEIPSLCLYGQNLSPFDMLCVSFFLQNSNMKWNHLHFDDSKQLKIFADSLLNHSQHNSTCDILDIKIGNYNIPSKFWSSSFLCNITECYCDCSIDFYNSVPVIMEFLNLSNLKVLHSIYCFNYSATDVYNERFLEQCSKIKQSLQKNCVIQEIMLKIRYYTGRKDVSPRFILSFIDGITKNKSIKSFSIILKKFEILKIDMSKAVVSLLENNYTLQALKLDIPEDCWNYELLPHTIEVNTPLTAVYIRGNSQLTKLIVKNCKSLLFVGPNPPCSPSDLLSLQPCLQQLDLSLTTVEQTIQLFIKLKCNSTLTAFQANIKNDVILADSNVGVSLKEMLEKNKIIQHLEILLINGFKYFPVAYLPYMTDGLKHNSTLRGLRVPIPLSHASEQTVASFVEVISDKHNICELHMDIFYHQCSDEQPSNEELTEIYYSLQPPLLNKILKKNARLKMLKIILHHIHGFPLQKEQMPLTYLEFMVLCHCHPSLQYIKIPLMFKDYEIDSFYDQTKKLRNLSQKSKTYN